MPQTNLGRVAFKFQGDYSALTTYAKYDVVFDGESSFVSQIDNNLGNELVDGLNWKYLAKGNNLSLQDLKQDVTDLETNLNKVETKIAELDTANTSNVTQMSSAELWATSSIDSKKVTVVNKRSLYVGTKCVARKTPSSTDFVMYTITDTHGDANGVVKTSQLLNGFGDCAALLGDVGFNDTMVQAILSSTKPFLCLLGNHDVVDYGYATLSNAYRDFINRFQSINNVVADGVNPYFYKDFPSKSIRVIGLFEYEYTTVGSPDVSQYGVVYSQDQIDWFVNTLLNAPKDYYIIVLHHQPAGVTRVTHADKFISSDAPLIYEFESGLEDTANIIPDIIEAFRTGVNLSEKSFASGHSGSTLSVTTEFTKASDKFIAHLAGHTHWDVVEYLPKYPNQLMIVSDQSCAGRYTYSDVDKTSGTDAAYLINRLTVDILEKTITIDRIGARVTTSGKIRDFVTYPFVPDAIDVGSIILTLNVNTLSLYNNSSSTLIAYLNGVQTSDVIFSSSDETIATVNSSGLVTAIAVGSCIITATNTANNITTTCSITNIENSTDYTEIANTFSTRVTSDGGTLLYSGSALTSKIAADSALIGGSTPRMAFYGYKLSGVNVVKLYSLDSLFDSTDITNIGITGEKLVTIEAGSAGKIIYSNYIFNNGLTKLYYKGNLVMSSSIDSVFINNILPYYGDTPASVSTNTSSNIFYEDGLIQVSHGGNGDGTDEVTAFAASTFSELYVSTQGVDPYVLEAKINGVSGVPGTPSDFWSSNLGSQSFIKIYSNFDRVLAG